MGWLILGILVLPASNKSPQVIKKGDFYYIVYPFLRNFPVWNPLHAFEHISCTNYRFPDMKKQKGTKPQYFNFYIQYNFDSLWNFQPLHFNQIWPTCACSSYGLHDWWVKGNQKGSTPNIITSFKVHGTFLYIDLMFSWKTFHTNDLQGASQTCVNWPWHNFSGLLTMLNSV